MKAVEGDHLTTKMHLITYQTFTKGVSSNGVKTETHFDTTSALSFLSRFHT
jgi:hypothetical protein